MCTCRSTSILSKLFNKLLSTLSPHLWREERGEGREERRGRGKTVRVGEERRGEGGEGRGGERRGEERRGEEREERGKKQRS